MATYSPSIYATKISRPISSLLLPQRITPWWGYDVSPLLYLVQPVKDAQLEYTCDIFLKKHKPHRILLNLPGETLSLNIDGLLHCKVFRHRVSLHLVSEAVREIRYSLNELEKQLPSSIFARSHQSYLVNMAHINSIIRYELILSTGQTLRSVNPDTWNCKTVLSYMHTYAASPDHIDRLPAVPPNRFLHPPLTRKTNLNNPPVHRKSRRES